MAKLKYLVIHCSYTPKGFQLTPDHIRKWHLKDNGWSRVGYSDLILRDGTLVNLSPYNQDDEVDYNEYTFGVKGLNGVSRHVCLEGGKGFNVIQEFPQARETLETYIKYTLLRHDVEVKGHCDLDPNKPFCPSFDVGDFMKFIF